MIDKGTLRQVILPQKDAITTPLETIPRELLATEKKWFTDNRILILTGVRRCGKSTLLTQLMTRRTPFCYVNFEHERFLDFKAQDFEQLHEVLIEAYGPCTYYFFDEIQNIEKFETFVRRLHDQGKKVILTGSNASLLSIELGTKLTGRYTGIEVYPFSFREFLLFKKEKIHVPIYQSEKKVSILKLFSEFLQRGGFPEYLRNEDDSYVQTIYENILYRDIVSRYSIKRQKILRELVALLMGSVSFPITYNSLKSKLGLANAITVKEYISHLCNSYLFFEIPQFNFSFRKQLALPKKIYSIDSGMYRIMGFFFSENKGSLLENCIFLELKRRFQHIYYYTGRKECDFIIKKGSRIVQALQVCYALTASNKHREIDGLMEALEFFKLAEGTILTYEQEEKLVVNKKKIHVIPAWKWLLNV